MGDRRIGEPGECRPKPGLARRTVVLADFERQLKNVAVLILRAEPMVESVDAASDVKIIEQLSRKMPVGSTKALPTCILPGFDSQRQILKQICIVRGLSGRISIGSD